MATLLLCAAVVAGVVVLTPLADRLKVPQPVLLTLFGMLLPLVPGTPGLDVEPDLILPVVLPPLLFAATQRSTAGEFRQHARPILLLAVGLTVASAAAVAVTAHLLGLPWGPAAVLGAVVAPPDPVAATAVARRLKLPGRLVTVLEGEGMFNDATALVLYGLAVAAVVEGELGAGQVAERLVLAVGGGIAIGLLAGLLTRLALAALHDASAETTVTVALPFVAYLLAEQVEGSGVLAVLSLGLYLRTYGHPAITSAGWLLGRAVWRYVDYLVTSVLFALIGFELTDVLADAPLDGDLVRLAVAVVLVVVLLRPLWLFPAVAVARAQRRRRDEASPVGTRETVVVSWAGMRGVVTIATALALPLTTDSGDAFPERESVVVVGLTVVLATLVVQGLTLSPLVRRLGVGSEDDAAGQVRELRHRAAAAGLEAVQEAGPDEVPEAVREAVVLQYQGYLDAQEALQRARRRGEGDDEHEDFEPHLEELQQRAGEAERHVVLTARQAGEVSPEAADEVLDDIEARAVRDL